MSAGAGYTPSASDTDVEASVGCYVDDVTGLPTPVIYEVDFDTSVSPPTATVQYLNYDGTVAALSPTEIASFSATACDQRAVSATIKLGSGNAANLAWGQDGTTFNFQTFMTSPGITTLLGGVAVLQGYEIVVEQGSNPASGVSVNRTEFTEPGSGAGTSAMRVLSQGESVRADASDADVAGLIVDAATGVTIFGLSRALIKVTVKRA